MEKYRWCAEKTTELVAGAAVDAVWQECLQKRMCVLLGLQAKNVTKLQVAVKTKMISLAVCSESVSSWLTQWFYCEHTLQYRLRLMIVIMYRVFLKTYVSCSLE